MSALIKGIRRNENFVNMVYSKQDDKICYIQSKAADLVVFVHPMAHLVRWL